MATVSTPGATEMPPHPSGSDFNGYESWFTASPDPWLAIARLEPGSDATVASALRRIVLNSEASQWPTLEAKLVQLIQDAGTTDAGRMAAVRLLALIGSAQCVAGVAPLLHDERTADVARYALDGIADPAVDTAYREALGKLKGRARIGLIASLALRNDKGAVPALQVIEQEANELPEVRAAAKQALAHLVDNT